MIFKKFLVASVLVIPLISGVSLAKKLDLTDAFKRVKEAKSTEELQSLYKGNPDVSGAINYLNKSVEGEDVYEWATKWALEFRDYDEEDESQDYLYNLNSRRGLCFALFRRGVDIHTESAKKNVDKSKWDHLEGYEKENAITKEVYKLAKEDLSQFIIDFKEQNILNLMHVTLAMDKAQALYKMKSKKNLELVGAPWVSEIPMIDEDISRYQVLAYEWGTPPMNKRYKALTYSDKVMEQLGYLLMPELPEWALERTK
ncbi:MAG: hypothetical protein AB8G05_07880 [Oligoflexales bacterium]